MGQLSSAVRQARRAASLRARRVAHNARRRGAPARPGSRRSGLPG